MVARFEKVLSQDGQIFESIGAARHLDRDRRNGVEQCRNDRGCALASPFICRPIAVAATVDWSSEVAMHACAESVPSRIELPQQLRLMGRDMRSRFSSSSVGRRPAIVGDAIEALRALARRSVVGQ